MKNKDLKIGVAIGAILAIPLFIFLLPILEMGVLTNGKGICPYHKVQNQLTIGSSKTICENMMERGIPEGGIKVGHICKDGIYYQTDYRCITKSMGFVESEASMIIWILLAEFYGILFGGIIGLLIKKFRKK